MASTLPRTKVANSPQPDQVILPQEPHCQSQRAISHAVHAQAQVALARDPQCLLTLSDVISELVYNSIKDAKHVQARLSSISLMTVQWCSRLRTTASTCSQAARRARAPDSSTSKLNIIFGASLSRLSLSPVFLPSGVQILS